MISAPFLGIQDPWIYLLQQKNSTYVALFTNHAMAPPTTLVLNNTSITPRIASQPEDASPSTAAHLLHKSQEQDPVPVAAAEVVVERSFRSPPALTTVSGLREFHVGDAIDGILAETGSYGCSADADAFLNALERIGPGVEVREGVSKSL